MSRYLGTNPPDSAFADALINLAKWPLRWIWERCDPAGTESLFPEPSDYSSAARELILLGRKYESFEAAYYYATAGRIGLKKKGYKIQPIWTERNHVRYDAYDRMCDESELKSKQNGPLVRRITDILNTTVQLKVGFEEALTRRFFYQVNELATELVSPLFRMPGVWCFPTASMAEYKSVLIAIYTLSLIHFGTRRIATDRVTYWDSESLIAMERDALVRLLSRYLRMDSQVVSYIVEELTFGHRLDSPDIALQPLVPLELSHLAWAPGIVLASSLERNLLVLLNRLPKSRMVYSRLSKQRETLMRESLCADLQDMGFRFWWGTVPGWAEASDLDLAIIDDKTTRCVLLELKAFVAPADPREECDKAKAVEHGVEQVKRRYEALQKSRKSLDDTLRIDISFTVDLAVVSESASGCGGVARVDDVAVVRMSQLVDWLRRERSLRRIGDWLSGREYLPTEGRDYARMAFPATIGRWTLEWYQLKLLDGDQGTRVGGGAMSSRPQ